MKTYFLFNTEIPIFWAMTNADDYQSALQSLCAEIGLNNYTQFNMNEWKILHQKQVRGFDAIEVMHVFISSGNYLARKQWCLRKYQDGADENRLVDIEEAYKISETDPSLIYLAKTFLEEIDGKIYRNYTILDDWQREVVA